MKEILKVVKGSQVYGTTVETSDTDYFSLFKHDVDTYLGNHYKDFIETTKDDTSMEVGKFIYLCTKGSPIQIETLYTPDKFIIHKDPCLDKLFKNRDIFITKQLRDSYTGFVKAQLHKAKNITKRLDWEQNEVPRKSVLDFCYIVTDKGTQLIEHWCKKRKLDINKLAVTKLNNTKEGHLLYKTNFGSSIATDKSNNLRTISIPKHSDDYEPLGVLLYNPDAYSSHCKKYKQYQDWLSKRNPERYQAIKKTGSIVDLKFFYHAVRLVNSCEEIFTDKTVYVDRRGRDAEYLLKIRQGLVDLESLNNYVEDKLNQIDLLYNNSDLPDSIDMDKVTQLVIKSRS